MINVKTLNRHFLTFSEVIAHILNTLIRDLRNVQQAVFTRKDRNERTKINDARNLTCVNSAHLSFSRDGHDHFNRRIARRLILTKDFYRAVIIDVDRRARLFCDLTNGCTALTNNVADLVGIDL